VCKTVSAGKSFLFALRPHAGAEFDVSRVYTAHVGGKDVMGRFHICNTGLARASFSLLGSANVEHLLDEAASSPIIRAPVSTSKNRGWVKSLFDGVR